MYSYGDLIRAVKLYIKLAKRTSPTIRKLKEAKEIEEQENRAARKERLRRFVGMWSHFAQDSVEIQNELRDDWS